MIEAGDDQRRGMTSGDGRDTATQPVPAESHQIPISPNTATDRADNETEYDRIMDDKYGHRILGFHFGSGKPSSPDEVVPPDELWHKVSISQILSAAAQRAKEFGSLDKEQQWEQMLSQRADVYMRGKSQIAVDKSLNVSTDQLHALMDTLDDLNRLYPGPNGQGRSITISTWGIPHHQLKDLAYTTPHGSLIEMLPGSLDKQALGVDQHNGWFMDSAEHFDITTYLLIHEFGHTIEPLSMSPETRGRIDEALDQSLQSGFCDSDLEIKPTGPYANYRDASGKLRPVLSRYGALNADRNEAYAEAFAEWTLSKGTTDNPFVQDIARSERWHQYNSNKITKQDSGNASGAVP